MNKVLYNGAFSVITPTNPDPKAKNPPAFCGKTILSDGQLLVEAGQSPQGKDVARTSWTMRSSRDIVVDDTHEQSRATAQFSLTGATTPSGLQEQKRLARALLYGLCADDLEEVDLRLLLNGILPSDLTEVSLTAIAAAVE